MATRKQRFPSFASTISVLSIAFYCVGFLKVELQLNDQKKRIDALENVAETKPPSNDPNIIKLIKNDPGEFVFIILTQQKMLNLSCFSYKEALSFSKNLTKRKCLNVSSLLLLPY